MFFMKVRSARKIPQANKMFTDREEPRQTFWKQYKLMKSQMDDIADIKVGVSRKKWAFRYSKIEKCGIMITPVSKF